MEWEPILLPNKARDIDRVEILDITRSEIAACFYVEDWEEVDHNLVIPKIINVDHYFEPLQPQETLIGDISERLFGVRHRPAMHFRNEVHWHSLDAWVEMETNSGHEQLVKECATVSAELRNCSTWQESRWKLHQMVATR